MGAPVGYVTFSQRFKVTQEQMDAYDEAVKRGALMAFRFIVDPKNIEVTRALPPTATISAEPAPWSADVEVKHG